MIEEGSEEVLVCDGEEDYEHEIDEEDVCAVDGVFVVFPAPGTVSTEEDLG